MPEMLGIDGLEYLPSAPTDTATLIPDLTVKNFTKYYHDDFLDWEKDTYGWNFDLHQFTHRNGRYLTPSKYVPRKKGIAESAVEAPNPLPHDPTKFNASIVIPISWKPTKHDIWYKENFSWEKRILYNNVSIAKFDYRDPIEFQRVQLVNSIIEQRKADSSSVYNPDLSSLKRRIRRIKADISSSAKLDLKLKTDSPR